MDIFHSYVTREIPSAGLGLLLAAGSVETWQGDAPPPRAELLERMAESDALLCLLADCIDAEVMDAAPRLKVISNYAVGTDNIDVEAASERGICVCNTPGVLTDATADLTWALLMAAARRVVEGDALVRSGNWISWDPQLLLGQPLSQRTLGIVGLGRIGSAVARRAIGFDMRVLYTARHRNEGAEQQTGASYTDLETLLRESDFVSIHCPLTPQTRGMIGAPQLAMMKPTAVIVNTGRGPVVDQVSLVEALRERRLFSAGLDVYDVEPLPPEHPILKLENAVLLPHLGSADVPTRRNMARMAAEAIIDVMSGKMPAHLVNYDVWDHRR
ncbi:MAG TPA: D-glycerate dehydrogenase [Armatimonadota bacterium]